MLKKKSNDVIHGNILLVFMFFVIME